MGHDSPRAIVDGRRRLAGSYHEWPSGAVALGTARLRASAAHAHPSDLCGRLLLWAAPSGRVSGCGSAPSQTNERSTAAAMARIDSGSSRTILVVGEIRAHPAADRIPIAEVHRGPGAPREGRALLQGLILCGQCGRRMKVLYNSRSAHLRYCCVRPQAGLPVCQDFSGRRLERGVEELVLEALQPVGMEAMIQAAADHGRACEAERAHWQQRVERARYEVDLARRQYEAVAPANRLVTRELERRFENALQGREEIESKTQAQMQKMDRPLTEEEQHTLTIISHQMLSHLDWNPTD